MEYADALGGLVAILLLILFWAGPWQRMCLDLARQRLFANRDRLFDMALEGKFEFDSEGYREARLQIERMIRYAHVMHLTEFLFVSLALKKTSTGRRTRSFMKSISNASARLEVDELLDKSTNQILTMMVIKSPFMFAIIPLAFATYWWSKRKSARGVGMADKFMQVLKSKVETEVQIAA